MAQLPLSLSICDYDRTRALVDGRVQPQGIALNVLLNPIETSVIRMLRYREFDIAEMSLSAAMIEMGRSRSDFVLLPIFPSRYFRHSALFVATSSSATIPEDLRGKRIATPTYARLTAGVWLRGILQDDYGVAPTDVKWVVAEPLPVGSSDRIPVTPPEAIHIESAPPGVELEQLLLDGEVDALITARLSRPLALGDGGIRRMFSDSRRIEAEYFQRTGIFPPMHVLMVRREIYENHPWIGPSLFEAFTAAKNLTLSDLYEVDVSRYSMAWSVDYAESELNLLGSDPWAYGLAANHHALSTLARYCYAQGLTSELVDAGEIFPENTRMLGIA